MPGGIVIDINGDIVDDSIEERYEEVIADFFSHRPRFRNFECSPIPKDEDPLRLRDRRDPAFAVYIKGENLDPLNISSFVESVEVAENEDEYDTCSIILSNLISDYIDDSIFNAQNEVEIYMGYLSDGLEHLGDFVIDKPRSKFDDNVSIELTGKDVTIKMAISEEQNVYNNVTDADILDDIANRHGFLAEIDPYSLRLMQIQYESIAQAGVSDYDLLRQRALLYGFKIDVIHRIIDGRRRRVIYFGPPKDCDSGVVLSYKDPNPYVSNLLNFYPVENTYKRGVCVIIGVHRPDWLGHQPLFPKPVAPVREEFEGAFPRFVSPGINELTTDGEVTPNLVVGYNRNEHSLSNSFNSDRDFVNIANTTSDQELAEGELTSEEIEEYNERVEAGEFPLTVLVDIISRRLHGTTSGDDNLLRNKKCVKIVVTDIGHARNLGETVRLTRTFQQAMQFVIEADAEPAIGHPKLRKGHMVTVKGVGKFSGRYYIKAVTHKIDRNGYKITNLNLRSRGTKLNRKTGIRHDRPRRPFPIIDRELPKPYKV